MINYLNVIHDKTWRRIFNVLRVSFRRDIAAVGFWRRSPNGRFNQSTQIWR